MTLGKKIGLSAFAVSALFSFAPSADAQECPWAGKAYRAAANNGKIFLRINDDCSVVYIGTVTKPNDARPAPLSFNGRAWVTPEQFERGVVFGRNGRKIQLRIGARHERLGSHEVKLN